MQLLDLTLPTPAENLALDEALLDAAEARQLPDEVLRLWESPSHAVVLGRSSQPALEVDEEACRRLNVPILRRPSGGASVVIGPGCLMYALILDLERRPHLRAIDEAHRVVLQILAKALSPLVPDVSCRGTSDLALADRKFSGNSMRVKRDHILYHGTLLYHFDLPLVSQLLTTPPRQPAYRESRSHGNFLTNLPLTADALRRALRSVWHADQPLNDCAPGHAENLTQPVVHADDVVVKDNDGQR